MAQFFDGYEQFRTTDIPNGPMSMAKYITRGPLSAGGGRLGNSIGISTLNSAYERDWTWSGDTLTIGFACQQFNQRGALFGVKIGDETGVDVPHIVAYTDPTSALITLQSGVDQLEVGYVTPLPGRWYYYEVVMNRTTKVIQVWVNGKADVAYTLPNEIAAAATIRLVFNPFDMMAGVVDFIEDAKIFDDMYARDGGRLGAIQISGRLPNKDKDKQWGVSSPDPAGPHWAMVGVLPPDVNNRFVYTGTNNYHDSYTSGDPLPDNGNIISQGLIALVRKATADPVTIIANINGDTVNMSNIGRGWEYRYTLFSASGYDKASIEAAEFGVRSQL